MSDIKFCERCCKKISDINTSDWYSHISIKYCEECRQIVKKEQTAARVQRLRQRKREKEKEQSEKLRLLEIENANLRKLLLISERTNHNEECPSN